MRFSMKTLVSIPPLQQAAAFETVPQRSLQMALCLNGSVPVIDLARAADPCGWLSDYLRTEFPEAYPGCTGPITIVLVL